MRGWMVMGCAGVAAVVVGEAHAQAPRYELKALQDGGQYTNFQGTSLDQAEGTILVRNGSAYQTTGVSYTAGVSHHLRMSVDVAANRYSVWPKLANQPERQLAASVTFRVAATQLDHWIARVDEASTGSSLSVCNARVP